MLRHDSSPPTIRSALDAGFRAFEMTVSVDGAEAWTSFGALLFDLDPK